MTSRCSSGVTLQQHPTRQPPNLEQPKVLSAARPERKQSSPGYFGAALGAPSSRKWLQAMINFTICDRRQAEQVPRSAPCICSVVPMCEQGLQHACAAQAKVYCTLPMYPIERDHGSSAAIYIYQVLIHLPTLIPSKAALLP